MIDSPRTSYKEGDDRFYEWPEKGTYPSVTTILSRLPARWLADWYARVIAENAAHFVSVCIDQAEQEFQEHERDLIENGPHIDWEPFKVNRMSAADHDAAVRKMKAQPAKQRDDAAAIGTMAHAAIHHKLEHGTKPDILDSGYVEAAENFLRDKGITPKRFELELANYRQQYAGTVDLIGRDKQGHAVAVDWKSGKRIYPKHAAQICALMCCTHYMTPQMGSAELPHIERGFVVQITEDGKYRPHEFQLEHASLMLELMDALQTVMRFSSLKLSELFEIEAWH